MATQDISRFLLQPNKHYSSLHLQQGRVIVDSDWNERASVEAEELRQTVLDIACARGTSNDGFAIVLPEDPNTTVGSHATYTFDIGGGSYYLGGMRLAIDNAAGEETFLTQSDWLQVTSLAAYMPAQLEAVEAAVTRVDLVYVYAWEQPVTAVEDRELAEVALGGCDSSTRVKRMRRFMVATGVVDDCTTAFSNLMTSLEEVDKAEYKHETGELVSNGRLQVTTTLVDASEDPCADPTAAGYVGADNQTIRVELRPGAEVGFDGKLIWGFDNASKLYRVQVSGTTVSFVTTPQDLASMPRAGQVVEFLQWGAKLPNSEKVAELQGLVTVVTSGYDPNSKEISIEAIPGIVDWNTWLAAHSEHYNTEDPADVRQFLYMRIWDRGSETIDDAADALIDYAVGTPVTLGNTGLEVTVTADGKDGDFWIIAARPSTPDVVTPWDLNEETGAPPHGPRRFYAPLALISTTDTTAATPTYSVQDCRTRLRKLCEGGACTVTVGDGKQSFGHFNSLQEAVDFVPPLSKICILPGEHVGRTVIEGASGLIIEGCGIRSVLKNPTPTGVNTNFKVFENPVISIENSSHVFIRDLAVTGYSAVGVAIAVVGEATCSNIQLERLTIESTGGFTTDNNGAINNWRLPAPGITVAAASEVEIVDCAVTMADVRGYTFAVVLGGDALSMRGCKISAPTNERVSKALGGVNIRSGSRDVEIIDCEITGGKGHGIALGHGRVYTASEEPGRTAVLIESVTIGSADSDVSETDGGTTCTCDGSSSSSVEDKLLTGVKFYPAGALENVRIYDNRIRKMGGSGISTAQFWRRTFDANGSVLNGPLFIVVTDIDIARNIIEDNVQSERTETLGHFEFGLGGVCLTASVNAWIHENTIRNNGTIFTTPMCGVGLVAAMNAVIEDNQIVDNGRRHPSGVYQLESLGLRGGIAIYEATALRTRSKQVVGEEMPSFPTAPGDEVPLEGLKNWAGVSAQAAVTVRGNEVSQPLGRALLIRRGFGSIMVTGNTLQSYGNPVQDSIPGTIVRWSYVDYVATTDGTLQYPAAGACVEISNYALPEEELWTILDGYPALELIDPGEDQIQGGSVLVSGNRMRLDWEWPGGWLASVLVQSIGAVVFNDNVSEVAMNNAYDPGTLTAGPEDDWNFATTLCEQESSYTFVLSNVVVGARGTISFIGNRLSEARWDAPFSAVVGYPALPIADDLVSPVVASLAIANIGSHCIVALSGDAMHLRADNAEVHPLKRIVSGELEYSCEDVELYTVDASSPRLVGLRMTIAPIPG